MGKVVQFVSRATTTAEKNLAAFVSLARDELTAFSEDGAWDGLTWRDHRRNRRVSVVFCKYRPRNEARRPPVPLAEPFLTFAKAYFRYRYSHKPVTSVSPMLDALRMIELALIKTAGKADIVDLSAQVLSLSTQCCADRKTNLTARYQSGRQIEAIGDFCRDHHLVPALPSWETTVKRPPTLTETLTEEGVQHRESKLPTNEQDARSGGLVCAGR